MANLSQINRTEMISALDQILKEHSDDEELSKSLRKAIQFISDKKYGLVWEDHEERVDEEMVSNIPVFTEDSERSFTDSPGRPINFLLEGDNLHSLYLLAKTNKQYFDAIYVDYPYNTEAKDFKYNDTYIDKTDGFRHSKWISFIERRLRLAHSLLKDDGCIMMSINENELFVLKLLTDEIFGEENYLTTITVKVRHEDRILKGDKDFHEVTEFLLFYRKSSEFSIKKREQDNTSLEEYCWEIEETGQPEQTVIDGKTVEIFSPFEYRLSKIDPSETGLKRMSIRGTLREGNSSGRFYVKNLEKLTSEMPGYLYKVYGMGADSFGYRYFRIPTVAEKRKNGDYFQGVPVERSDTKYVPYPNYFDFEEDFNNVASEGGVDFRNGKKPLAFLIKMLTIAGIGDKKNAKILDFFAGSGSTLEAVHSMNKLDDGNRLCVLCTNNDVGSKKEEEYRKEHDMTPSEFEDYLKNPDAEWKEYLLNNGICTSIAYPRIVNVSRGYDTVISRRNVHIGAIPLNLKYYHTDFIPKIIDEGESIGNRLLQYVSELIQLQYNIDSKDPSISIVLDDDSLDQLFNDEKRIAQVKHLFISSSVMPTQEQNVAIINRNIDCVIIPDYYFNKELTEVGEL